MFLDPLLTTDCTLEVLTLFGQFLDGLTNSDRQEGMVCQTTLKILHLLQVRFEVRFRYYIANIMIMITSYCCSNRPWQPI
jgi:hypothetical protein